MEENKGMSREEAFAATKTHLARLIETLSALEERARRGDGTVEADAKKAAAQMTSTLGLLLQTENKIDDLERRSVGGCEPIDLGAARDEIGRRLDRLRAAGNA